MFLETEDDEDLIWKMLRHDVFGDWLHQSFSKRCLGMTSLEIGDDLNSSLKDALVQEYQEIKDNKVLFQRMVQYEFLGKECFHNTNDLKFKDC